MLEGMENMSNCTEEGCRLNAFNDYDKCILHCKKEDYVTDWNKLGFLQAFYDALLIEIHQKFIDNILIKKQKSIQYLTDPDILLRDLRNPEKRIEGYIQLNSIKFPGWHVRDTFNYVALLSRLGSIHFISCNFQTSSLEIRETKLFFQNCQFNNNWQVAIHNLLPNENNVLYQKCEFNGDVNCLPTNGIVQINITLFRDCNFQKELNFSELELKSPIFNNTSSLSTRINIFTVKNTAINSKFVLNNCTFDKFISVDSVFTSKFEFKENEVKTFLVTNSNFEGLFDAYKTRFTYFEMQKIICSDFVGFEHCDFGIKNDSSMELVPRFLYATFMSFVNFRNTKFYSGLDIEHINFKESPNFLNSEITPQNSNRETFRIIKNSFDEIGNHLEANNYFIFEMKKYKEELDNSNKYQEKLIFFLNEKVSNFGQSYLRPLGLMVAFSIVYYILVLGYENEILYKIFPPANSLINSISAFSNDISKNILPFSKFLNKGMEFISLVFYVIYASLIWQILVSVKRHTRR